MRKKKKLFVALALTLALVLGVIGPAQTSYAQQDIMEMARERGYQVDEKYRPKASIVIDAETGKVAWADNADVQRNIASLTKLMTIYLALEAIEEGKFTFETTLQPSQNVIDISNIYSLSNNKMVAGVDYSVSELFSLIFVPSSNAATVMLANLVSGDDEALFINKMNEKAAELGMTNTLYYNATGATSSSFEGYYLPEGIDPNGDNYSTARDLSILIYNMLKKYPKITEFTSNLTYTVHPGTPSEETFDTYLASLPGAKYGYEGFDGLKTGSSPSAAFGYVGTAKRGDLRLIEVILGVGDWSDQLGEEERHPIGNALLDQVFDKYEYKKVLAKGEQDVNGDHVILEDDLFAFLPKNEEVGFTLTDNQLGTTSTLQRVSDLVPEKTVTVKKEGLQKTEEKTKNKAENSPTAGEKIKGFFKPDSLLGFVRKYIFSLLTILIGLFFVLLSRLFRTPNRGQRHVSKSSSGGQLGLIFGLLLIVIGLGMSILNYVGIINF